MVHDQSATGSTLFIEPMAIVKLNNEIRELEIQEQKEIEAVLASLSNEAAPHIEELRLNMELLAQLDLSLPKPPCPASTGAVRLYLMTKAAFTSKTDATRS